MADGWATQHRCPVCWQAVDPTIGYHIPGHLDTLGHDVCPGSFEPFHITMIATYLRADHHR